MKFHLIFPVFSLLFLFTSCKEEEEPKPTIQLKETTVSEVIFSREFYRETSYGALKEKNTVCVQGEKYAFFIGYYFPEEENKAPIVAKFEKTIDKDSVIEWKNLWYNTSYESTDDDCSGYGLIWDKEENLYAVFSTFGTRGKASQDFRRFATNGWLTNYGQGDGKQVSIIAKLNPQNGNAITATYLYSVFKSGNSNRIKVTGFDLDIDDNLIVRAESWYTPLNIDKIPFDCGGSTPFDYTISFTNDLSTAISASVECL